MAPERLTVPINKVIWVLTFLLGGTYVSAQSVRDEEAIRNVMALQQEAWNKGNIDAFMQGYWQSDSLKFVGSRGITYGWQNTLERYKKGYPTREAMGTLTFTILSLEFHSKDAAVMIGKYELKRSNDSPSGHFVLLWRKIKGKWLITIDHTS